MKKILSVLSIIFFLSFCGRGVMPAIITDPVKDYLVRSQDVLNSRDKDTFFSNDKVYKYEVDLKGDGKREVIISSTLEQDGQQGFEFYVYLPHGAGYTFSGNMFLPLWRFYVGKIDELNSYGAVTFFPSGGHEGGYGAYILEGEKIIEKTIGVRYRDPQTLELKGPDLDEKYFGSSANIVEKMVEIISASDLAARYGVKVDLTKTYEQSLREKIKRIDAEKGASKTTPLPANSAIGSRKNAQPVNPQDLKAGKDLIIK